MSVKHVRCPSCGSDLIGGLVGLGLTPTQRSVYEFYVAYIVRHAQPPTLKEVQDHFGYATPATVHEHVQHLIEAGAMERTASFRARAVVPILTKTPEEEE